MPHAVGAGGISVRDQEMRQVMWIRRGRGILRAMVVRRPSRQGRRVDIHSEGQSCTIRINTPRGIERSDANSFFWRCVYITSSSPTGRYRWHSRQKRTKQTC